VLYTEGGHNTINYLSEEITLVYYTSGEIIMKQKAAKTMSFKNIYI